MAALGWSEPTDKTDPSVSLSPWPATQQPLTSHTYTPSKHHICQAFGWKILFAEVPNREVTGSLDINIQSWSSIPGKDVQLPTNWQFVGFFSICQEVQQQIEDVEAGWRLICALTFLASEWIPYKYRKPAASVAVYLSVTLCCECTSYPSIQP